MCNECPEWLPVPTLHWRPVKMQQKKTAQVQACITLHLPPPPPPPNTINSSGKSALQLAPTTALQSLDLSVLVLVECISVTVAEGLGNCCRILVTPWVSMWWCSTALTRWTTRAWARSTRVFARAASGVALTSSTGSTWTCCLCAHSR